MSRAADLDQFYAILARLKAELGCRRLADCNATLDWPKRGVYFFFEEGELRQADGRPRVVRVGTHGVSAGSKTTLWNRLSQHRGQVSGRHPGSGNHRGSIFRYHVGTALISRHGLDCPSWHQNKATPAERAKEVQVEVAVSGVIGQMPFLWLAVADEAGAGSLRKYVERNAIALLSNYERPALDPPSPGWLGHHCAKAKVRMSGLWNAAHVDEDYDPAFLAVLARLVAEA